MAHITFHGAARQVTGSCYLLESPALGKVLMECGMRQGGDAVERVEGTRFPFAADELDAVILSHAHLDHSGLLPKLVQAGYRGPIHCTRATHGLLRILLEDAFGLYERDLEYDNKRLLRKGKQPQEPEYTKADVERALKQCQPAPYETDIRLTPGATLRFLDAGHILGAAIVQLTLQEGGKEKRLVFSGDLGNRDSALMNDPALPTRADIVMMEGTYGDRNHRSMESTLAELEEELHLAWQRGGSVMIPSFAVGRAQELIFHLGCLHQAGKLDDWTVFLDSPMAIEVTRVYDNWLHLLDNKDVRQLTRFGRESLENFLPALQLSQSVEESRAINEHDKGVIVIAGSGMCTGGRIRHHFKHRIWNEKNTILFVGFQAQGTLGRLLVDGLKEVRMFGDEFVVKARIATLGGFSAHAGQAELIQWAAGFQPSPRLLLVHGEVSALETLSAKLSEEHGISAEIPAEGDLIEF